MINLLKEHQSNALQLVTVRIPTLPAFCLSSLVVCLKIDAFQIGVQEDFGALQELDYWIKSTRAVVKSGDSVQHHVHLSMKQLKLKVI